MSSNADNYDISIIRPQMRDEDFGARGRNMTQERLRAIRKGLLTLNTLELIASTIYRFQICGDRDDEFNRFLIMAMCNEMTHYQDFQVKLYEYGFRPSKIRWAYWIAGFALGRVSRLLGRNAVLKIGIWVESKAVRHYSELLDTIDWDDDTRKIIEKDQADEDGHIARWKYLLHSDAIKS